MTQRYALVPVAALTDDMRIAGVEAFAKQALKHVEAMKEACDRNNTEFTPLVAATCISTRESDPVFQSMIAASPNAGKVSKYQVNDIAIMIEDAFCTVGSCYDLTAEVIRALGLEIAEE